VREGLNDTMETTPTTPLVLDGAEGEGGGQILRSALSLSLLTGRPFRVENIRAGRARPGLLRQHLTAVHAAAEVGAARVEGAELGARALTFTPTALRGGVYTFRVGTAGSATLVCQTVLPALLGAKDPSVVTFEGGTHNPMAPSVDFLDRVFLPALRRMGADVAVSPERHGFYPAGGGRFSLRVTPSALAPVTFMERGAVTGVSVTARVAGLAYAIAEREVASARERLDRPCVGRAEKLGRTEGPGNVALVEVQCEHATELFALCGERGVSAEEVGRRVADEALAWIDAEVPVGEHLADQLLLPLALAGSGRFVTVAPSLHTVTNARVIERFLPVAVALEARDGGRWEVTVRPAD
jgi:RNA 3'-terminal phosphate cyclase (ATP)